MSEAAAQPVPVQPVDDPVISSPYEEPREHYIYKAGVPTRMGGRRPASYWFKTERTGGPQLDLLAEEERDDLQLANLLRDDVRRWRESGWRGASPVTQDLLRHWGRADRSRRLFFCQLEAVETIVYLLELRIPGRSSRTGFRNFALSDSDLALLLRGQRPGFSPESSELFPALVDPPADPSRLPLLRLGCKMATGSGKTIVMAMLIAWSFCNRGRNPASREYANAVLVCCPNLTVKKRLQVLRPDDAGNYYDLFDVIPATYRELLNGGKVLVTNWHLFAPKSENREGDRSYRVVQKGEESDDAFARDRLGELFERLPILVMNDEGHHCWRPAPSEESLTREERAELEDEEEEARVWLEGLDRLNNCGARGAGEPCISAAIDLSATPFYLKGSGHPEGRPFPWLVSDFGLVDAIESGIVKIPRLPVFDDRAKKDEVGRPDPKYFRLWRNVQDLIPNAERLQNGRPKPEAVYREAEGALKTIAAQWVERFEYIASASSNQEKIPPVLIVVCDNTEIAEVFFRKISGEREEDVVEVEDLDDEDNGEESEGRRSRKPRKRAVYGDSEIFPHFSNTSTERRTVRIDTKLLREVEAGEAGGTREQAAEALRQIIDSVGKRGGPGEHVRCVVSVAMLTEGWDANNVTHILGVRAFDSQLLCEQVVGRGLRRMSYDPKPDGLLPSEYVDVYGIPFSIIPFKGRATSQTAPEDRPRNHVYALPERKDFEIRFPVVEDYVYALRQEGIQCDVDSLEPLEVSPTTEPTLIWVDAARGYLEEPTSLRSGSTVTQDREGYYAATSLQTILFRVTQEIVDDLLAGASSGDPKRAAALRLQARHQLFPQVFRIVKAYVERKVNFHRGVDPRELGLARYSQLLRQRIREGILPAAAAKDVPLLPVLNGYRPFLTTAKVDYSTIRPVFPVERSHVNVVVKDSEWEEQAAKILDEATDLVECFVRNEHQVGLMIRYEYLEEKPIYEPDFIVRLKDGLYVLLEVKGFTWHDPDRIHAKNTAAKKWVSAVNNLGEFGRWVFHICYEPPKLHTELTALLRH